MPPSDPFAVDSLDSLAYQAEEDRTNLTSKNEIESENLLQLQEWSLDLFIYFITTSLYFDGIYLAKAISSL